MPRTKIKLTQGKFAIVDEVDYEYLNQFNWCYNGRYATRNSPTIEGKQITILMHRTILERVGCTDFTHSDHINQDKLDNRRCNLRPATSSQNKRNTGKHNDNTSGFKGVYWFKRDKKWHARIMVNGKLIHLGYYEGKLKAAKVYNEAAKKYHGEFLCVNDV